jgi:hypothetical protein
MGYITHAPQGAISLRVSARYLLNQWGHLRGLLAMLVGLSSLQATTVTPPEFSQLVNEADYVVRAVVKGVTVVEKANPGKRTLPYSMVELEVKQVIVGTPPSPVILEVLGGKIDGREMYIEGAPRFTVGEEAIFFVQGNRTQIFPLVRMMHGLYPIKKSTDTGREYVTRSDGEPMKSTVEVQRALHREDTNGNDPLATEALALSPESFVTQIRSAAGGAKSHAK